MNEPLTVWDAKERAGLLTVETEECRDKRRLAEDPDTTTAVLADITRQALEARTKDRFAWFTYLRDQRESAASNRVESEDPALWKRAPWRHSELLFQAIAAHPNTSPSLLTELIGTAPLIPQVTSAFFRNPAAPSLLLNHSTFFSELDIFCQLLLLREATAFPLFVERVAESEDVGEGAAKAAKMHIAIAGEVTDDQMGRAEMQTYWRGQWGMITPYSRTHQWQANLLPEKAYSPRWTDRLDAASQVDATNTPMSEDFFDRTGLDLLHHLTHDGNRFVRWRARTQLTTNHPSNPCL